MKIFKVSINNNPGGWKSGEDPSELVIANSEEEAIEKVKNGWSSDYDFKNNYLSFGFYPISHYINENTTFSGVEIKFSGYDITTIREEKLKRIIK
ncbi:hypothetical protein M0Q97_05430 [Candidatus Dojkabacteria bacterium]|jgi:hypothetical protein|nr:hypothetical protein [Candidatus Dojkabacteria bacterium]